MNDEKTPTTFDAAPHSTGDGAKEEEASGVPSAPGVIKSWDEDVRLMTMVASGDAQAMNLVARRLSPRVRRLSRMMVRNDAVADDAAQVALVEILQSAHTYGGRSSLERWADRITARITLRHVRDERRRFQVVEPLENGSTDVAAEGEDPADSVRAESPRDVQEYLKELPEAQQQALVMKHSLGYTVEEIAEMTSVPVGTVKDRLVTARRQLRRLIQRDLNLGRGKGKRS